MISTKMSPEEAKEYSNGPMSAEDAPAYSYGTTICLDDELLERLGMMTPPPVGTSFMLMARVTVTTSSVTQNQGGDKESRCELQITDMELNPAPSKPDSDVMYGD